MANTLQQWNPFFSMIGGHLRHCIHTTLDLRIIEMTSTKWKIIGQGLLNYHNIKGVCCKSCGYGNKI